MARPGQPSGRRRGDDLRDETTVRDEEPLEHGFHEVPPSEREVDAPVPDLWRELRAVRGGCDMRIPIPGIASSVVGPEPGGRTGLRCLGRAIFRSRASASRAMPAMRRASHPAQGCEPVRQRSICGNDASELFRATSCPTQGPAIPSPGARLTRGAAYVAVLLCLALPQHGRAQDAEEVLSTWSLVPSGLGVGDSFRLLFVSSTTRNAQATNINNYNNHVRNAAAADAAHADIQAYSDHFRALGSTEDDDAIDNTGTTFTTTEPGVPIYWLGGAKVADDYSDFYDDSWDSNAPRNEAGNTVAADTEVFTGTLSDGSKHSVQFLGRASGNVRVGSPDTSGDELDARGRSRSQEKAIYGLSGVFTVVDPPPPTPVPTVKVQPTWGLAPAGLSDGDSFRLLFVSSTTRGAGPDEIARYDRHIQDAAASGHAAIREYSAHFSVLGSTATVDARDHTVTSSTAVPVVPIYWLGGAKVADDYTDLYDGTWDSNVPRNEFGSQVATDIQVFTGSESDGTGHNQILGHANRARIGKPGTSGEELDSGAGLPKEDAQSFYALSGVFTLSLRAGLPNRARVTLSPPSVSEDSPTTVTVTVTLDDREPIDTELQMQVRDDTASSPDDFTAQPRTLTVTVPAGQLEGSGSFTVTPVQEQQGEPECDETIAITGVPTTTAPGSTVIVPRGTLMLSDPDADARRCGSAAKRSAVPVKVESPPDPPRQEEPDGVGSTSPSTPPTEAKVVIWTDRLGYLDGESLRLYRSVDPMGDERNFTYFYYLENIGTGRRLYFAPGIRSTTLEEEAVDHLGLSGEAIEASRIDAASGELIWAGAMPEAGSWHFVAEVRGPDATEVVKAAYAKFKVVEHDPSVYGSDGTQTVVASDETWGSDRIHKVRQPVHVRAGATLTIEAGALVQSLGANARIVVERGGRIEAIGSRASPIVMTCDRPVGQREPGCWGGLAVKGGAPVGDEDGAQPDDYGGDDPEDSSGELRFVRVEFAGGGPNASAPRTALALYGVGSGTAIDHVQVHESRGVGIEFRGGTAHCRYCISSGARDDSLKWSGWQGTAQHVLLQQGLTGDKGIEARGGGASTPGPVLHNATLVGGSAVAADASSGVGIHLGDGAAVTARNLLVTGFGSFAITAESETAALFVDGQSSIANTILFENGGRYGVAQAGEAVSPYIEFLDADPDLLNTRYEANPDPRPRAGSPALKEDSAAEPPSGETPLSEARYIGAFGAANWLEEWTFFGPESEYRLPEPEESTEPGGSGP